MKGPGLRFVVWFAALMAAGELVYLLLVVSSPRYAGYLELNAELTRVILGVLGYEVVRDGARLVSDLCWFEVIRGCDGIQLLLLYGSAVLAFPGRRALKLLALFTGLAVVFVLNQVRLVSLFLTLAHAAPAYDTVHLTVWPPVLILCVLGLWSFWALRMTRPALS